MTDQDDLETIRSIIADSAVALLTTRNASGELHSRPLAVLDQEFEGTIWFFTEDPSQKTTEIASNHEVNVAFADSKGYLSIAGAARIEHDRERISELWNPAVDAWFEGGRDDPKIALLRVDGHSAEYWAVDKPGVVRAFEFAKGIVTGSRPDIGINRAVDL